MIKVLIVDDEFYSREGLKKVICWNDFGCVVCGEAEDGQEAIELARNLKPDLIITDINMPAMNGIDMAKVILGETGNTKFIIITGYDDFQYARGAIKINAVDFILKPIEIDEFLEALKKAVNIINNEKTSKLLSCEKQLLQIMRGQKPIEDIETFFKREEFIKVILINNDSYTELEEKKQEKTNFYISSFVKSWIEERAQNNAYVLEAHVHRIAIIVKGSFEEETLDLEGLNEEIEKLFKGSLSMSSTTKQADEIQTLYSVAKLLLEDSFYEGGGKVIRENKHMLLSLDFSLVNEYIKEIISSIIYNNRKVVEKSLGELYTYMRNGKFNKNIILKVSLELIVKIKNELSSLSIPITELEKLEFKRNYKYIQEIETVIYEFVTASIDLVREYHGKLEDSSLEKAIKYINENYNRNISLRAVANHVYLNESYLSRSLKHRLGMGFSEYIRGLRMEKAIELLKIGYSISRVAEEVGYSDYRQFSINFKKYTGYNPSSYR